MTSVLDFRRGAPPPDLEPPKVIPGAGIDFESDSARFEPGFWPLGPLLTKVFTTKKRWRALDVYVDMSGDATLAPATPIGILNVFVFAVTQVGQASIRTLIASGRMAGPALSTFELEWVAAARSVAQQFEVAVSYSFAGGAPPFPPFPLRLIYVASDQAVDPPPLIGTLKVSGGPTPNVFQVASTATIGPFSAPPIPEPELVGVECVIDTPVAAARFLQMFDQAGPVVIAGSVPRLIWPLGNAAGQGVVDMKPRYRTPRGLCFRSSSTAATFTSTVDCPMMIWIR